MPKTKLTAGPIFNPAILLSESPEGQEGATCPHCGDGYFVGYDLNSAQYQRFTPPDDYDSYEGEIGEYEVVICMECDRIVWYDDGYFLPDRQIDALVDAATAALGEGAGDMLSRMLQSRRVSFMVDAYSPCEVVLEQNEDDPNNV